MEGGIFVIQNISGDTTISVVKVSLHDTINKSVTINQIVLVKNNHNMKAVPPYQYCSGSVKTALAFISGEKSLP